MDGIADKLSQLLSDPDGMERIRSLAEGLLGGKEDEPPKSNGNGSDGDVGLSLPDGFDIGKMMGLLSAFNNQKTDRRSELLLALKPHLSQERREKVDKAVKFLKIAALLPILKDQGILDLF